MHRFAIAQIVERNRANARSERYPETHPREKVRKILYVIHSKSPTRWSARLGLMMIPI